MYAPIVLFAYNRLSHLRNTVASLKTNDYAKESELYIFCDKEKNDEERIDVLKVQEYVKELNKEHFFKKTNCFFSTEHKGLANSVIYGVNYVFETYDKVIVVEDDLILARTFLKFMNAALNYYEKNSKIWSISGYTLSLRSIRLKKQDVYAGYRGSSWGWATWKDRWNSVDWNVKEYCGFINNSKQIALFNRGGEDMTQLLIKQMNGESDSWAIRWNFQQFKENMVSIFPTKSQVKNQGWDGSGRNCNHSILKIFDTNLGCYEGNIEFSECEIDERIMKETRLAYGKSLIGRFKIVLARKITF